MSKKRKRVMNMQRRPSQKQQTQVQAEAQSGGESTTYYVHGPRGIHAQQQDGEWKWMIQDGLNSVRGVTDNDVAVQQSLLYDSYGNPIDVVGPEQTMYGYTGEPTDPNGLVYLRERYYNPGMGTFISQDPTEGSITDPMSLNRYAYVQGNPINMTDPSGQVPINQAINNMVASNPLAFAQMMNAGLCNFQQSDCAPFCTNTPQPTGTPSPTGTPTATPNPCVPTPTMTPIPSGTPGTPFPTVTPIPFNTARIQTLSDADLELIALDIYYEARDYPEHWEAIANVWFNRLADPYATTTNVQRLLADNSAGWSDFVRRFHRGTSTTLDPLNLSADDIQIIKDHFTGYSNSGARADVDTARNTYPSSQYSGMLAFYHADAGRVNEQVCEMGCVAAAPGQDVANNLARRGALRVVTVPGSRTLIMNNGIFLPGPSLAPNSFCATCCRNNNP